jgi:hypothetical protein
MVINFFGRRGSGKTTVIKGQLQDCKPPIVIIDYLGNFQDVENAIQTDKISAAILKIKEEYPKLSKNNKLIINLKTYDYDLAADYMSAVLWECRGGTLILDEVDGIDMSDAPCFEQIIRYGRNAGPNDGVHIITGCRRPAELSKNITAAANKFYCFQTHEPRDMDYFSELFGDDAYQLLTMPPHTGLFLDYDKNTVGRFRVDTNGYIFHTQEVSVDQSVNTQGENPDGRETYPS